MLSKKTEIPTVPNLGSRAVGSRGQGKAEDPWDNFSLSDFNSNQKV